MKGIECVRHKLSGAPVVAAVVVLTNCILVLLKALTALGSSEQVQPRQESPLIPVCIQTLRVPPMRPNSAPDRCSWDWSRGAASLPEILTEPFLAL